MRLSQLLLVALAVLMAAILPRTCEAKTATASHILVKSELLAVTLLEQLTEDGADFEELAKEHSTCPSRKRGGSLGTFPPGQMVAEFDKVAFSAPLNKVQGPVKSRFGYHLILVSDRSEF